MVLDTQSVHAAAGVPAATSGHDPAKRVPGRKRGLAVDVLGLVIAVVVLAANTHDNAAGIILLDQVAGHAGGTVRKALVDQGFKNQVIMHGAGLGIDVEIVERNPALAEYLVRAGHDAAGRAGVPRRGDAVGPYCIGGPPARGAGKMRPSFPMSVRRQPAPNLVVGLLDVFDAGPFPRNGTPLWAGEGSACVVWGRRTEAMACVSRAAEGRFK